MRAWVERIVGPGGTPDGLSETEQLLLWEEVFSRRKISYDRGAFAKAMVETTPTVGAPTRTNLEEDLTYILCQPEVLRAWAEWQLPARSGPKPNIFASKALLFLVGIGGRSAHFEDAYEDLTRQPALRAVFEQVESLASGQSIPGQTPAATLEMPAYSTVMRGKDELAKQGKGEASPRMRLIHANVELLKALRKLLPNHGIGERLMIDGTAIPAWVPQRSAGLDDRMREE